VSLLRLEALTVTRGDRTLLRDLDFALMPARVLHLLGPNGVGKTSLLEIVAGLRPANAGRVVIEPAVARHWLGHRNGLNPNLSVLENLQFWCAINGVDSTGVRPSLARLGVEPLRHRAARTLSTGKRRRVALSRLLIQPRALWVLDEPLAGLDVDGVGLFAGLVEDHLDGDGAVLLTSHQPLPLASARIDMLNLASR